MSRLSLATQRRLFGWGIPIPIVAIALWVWSPGLPVFFGPSARAADIQAGRELFEHEWAANDPLAHGDGLGPVFNAKSCAACHFQGGLGGGGSLANNAVGYEIFPRPNDPEFHTGTIHAFSIDSTSKESLAALKSVYPIVRGRSVQRMEGCAPETVPDFDPVRTQTVQATALFGAGWIDLISDKAIYNNQRNRRASTVAREFQLDFTSVPVGRVPTTDDGRVGKFGWKGQTASLSEFVSAACANELGLGTPTVRQATPLRGSASDVEPDLDRKQVKALVAFVKTLPKPEEIPSNAAAAHGKDLFKTVGCAACHTPDLGGVKGVYSDFLLYTLDNPNPSGGGYGSDPPRLLNLPPRPEDKPKPEEWKTPPLWGVADSAPYFHDGASPTLASAISRHQGDAATVTKAYQALNTDDQAAVIAFLNTLRAPKDVPPVRPRQ
ncbi:di-heme oxidoredictase family protein [Zavarzinella formosa]|uniref:di-heme oxidoredictase family protein n=1 Tax=Zavarzinella formosa TaxID=360055 RepID=UPI000360E79D|nr:di-heme oxidoredictase family protein [Zavarzinella formosa]